MPTAFEFCCEKDINAVFRDFLAYKARTKCKNIGVVMLPAKPCRSDVMTKARADPVMPVRGNAYANSRTTYSDSVRRLPLLQGMSDRSTEIGIID